MAEIAIVVISRRRRKKRKRMKKRKGKKTEGGGVQMRTIRKQRTQGGKCEKRASSRR